VKIYTGGGDRGKTSLFSGERVSKYDARIETYGAVDELNSIIGALIAALSENQPESETELIHIQSDLFHLSAWLATTPDSPSKYVLDEFSEEKVRALENAIDRMDQSLPQLKNFILPGGHISAAWAHIARTVCRRAERHLVRLLKGPNEANRDEQLNILLVYINRLSDYLFTLARYCNKMTGVAESIWSK
jgi:cob(I)alamin adenosyltransferase